MSHEFDLLWNNLMSNQAPGLGEYEKSVLLTKAQDEVEKNYLVRQSPGNRLQAGVEDIAKRNVDFSKLTVVETPESASGTMHPASVGYTIPTLARMILSETATLSGGCEAAVMPLSSEEFLRLMSKPYKYPLKGQCWRLMGNNGTVEVIPPYGNTITSYVMRYIRRSHPIIISAFPNQALYMDFGGQFYGGATADPESPEALHEDIVQRAVELAKGAWSSNESFVAMGQRTE